MIIINPQQGRERYKIIPRELQDLIFSETTKELFDHIGEENHLGPEKTYELGRVAGLVLLGFLHKDDTRKEFQEVLAVNPMIANELQNELNKKLFNPVSDLLEKIYSPLSKNTLNSTKKIDSVIPSKPVSIDSMPKSAPLPAVAPTIVPTKPPLVTPSFTPSVPPAAFPSAATPIPAAPATPDAIKKSSFVFTGSPIPPSSTNQTQAMPKPMPFVTQTNSQSAPVGNVPKFKIETPGTLSGSAFGGSNTPSFSSAPRPAKIELGFSAQEKKTAPTLSTTFETQKSSVRYGAPTTPVFSVQPSPMPLQEKPNTQIPALKDEISSPAKKIEVTVSGLKIPPSPPKIEPPKPLL